MSCTPPCECPRATTPTTTATKTTTTGLRVNDNNSNSNNTDISRGSGCIVASIPLGKQRPKSRLPGASYTSAPLGKALPKSRFPAGSTSGVLPGATGHNDFDDHADQNDHTDHNDDDNCDTGACDVLEALRIALKRVRFAAPAATSEASCRAIDVEAKVDLTAEDSCRTDAREFDSSPIAADSCKSNAIDDEETCESIDAETLPTPSIAKMGASARRSNLRRFRRGRQRDRRALQANTEVDIEFLRRCEVEIVASRTHQSTRERQLRDICSLGTSTTIDEISNVAVAPILDRSPQFDGDRGSSVCLASAAVKVWDDHGNRDEIHPAHLHHCGGDGFTKIDQ